MECSIQDKGNGYCKSLRRKRKCPTGGNTSRIECREQLVVIHSGRTCWGKLGKPSVKETGELWRRQNLGQKCSSDSF